MKKTWLVAGLTVLTVLCFLIYPASAAGESLPITLSPSQGTLTDGRETVAATVQGELTVSSTEEIRSLYVIFLEDPGAVTLVRGEKDVAVESVFLRQFWDLEALLPQQTGDVTLMFENSARILECYAFGEEVPDWVQRWESPWDKADLCLFTSHADDEQLFFAGILPYYAVEKDYRVQVVYFTDHKNEPLRRHELLNGLWEVGIRHYPVISPFPDLYSTTLNQAQTQLENLGYSYEDVVGYQTEILRRFQPLVVVGHDANGEYGHGQHMLNSKTLREAVEGAASEEFYPESAETYGVWDVPKTYLHLWEENPVTMNWDVPLKSFNGLTAFQVTQRGFEHHESQHYTWFRRWLLGNNGEIREASEITTHSPCQYGLYRSTVGKDWDRNDFFENITTWDEKFRLEEEERQAALLAEQERLAAEAEAREREIAYRLALEEEAREKAKKAEKGRLVSLLIGGGVLVFLIPVAIILWVTVKKHKEKKKRHRHRHHHYHE